MAALYRSSSRGDRSRPPIRPRSSIGLEEVVRRLEDHGRDPHRDLLVSALEFSTEMHEGQKRLSGEPYVSHPLYVAYLLADLGFDASSVVAGLLHDVLEDTLTTRKVLDERFGREIASLVEGVTKIGRHAYVRRNEAQAETFRKLILASAEDIRAIVVKLADRLHNMLTLEHMDSDARRRIARETLEIYAPIAHRLGMSRVQGELEDLAFYFLYPLQFGELEKKLKKKLKLGRDASERIRSELMKSLAEAELEADISYRVKRFYSIHRKLQRQGVEIDQLYDYLAYRVITSSIRDCYAALGVVHQRWRPVPGRFKDYIAMPKPNLYQSLHTTVLGEAGQPFEVQIRTREMDQVAEEGIAAHWTYKENGETAGGDPNISWLRQLLEWQKEVEDPRTFLSTLKIDLYPDEVYVFSPKGEVFSFPRGATPIDFAYRIHTDLGHHCVQARINGRLVPLRTPLQNGHIVEIVTNPARFPSRDWLNIVVTSRAKSKIRQWLNAEQNKRAIEIGRRVMERELKRSKSSLKKLADDPKLEEYLNSEGIGHLDDLLSRVGFGKLQGRQVVARILGQDQAAVEEEEPGRLRQAVSRLLPFGGDVVRVRGHGDLLAYLAKCCSPVPGEEIVGYITRGKGVSVHSAECPNVRNLFYNPEREIEVEWEKQAGEVYPVVLSIETEDQPGMLARLTEAIAKQEGNIRQIEAVAVDTGRGAIEVIVEVRDRRHLRRLSSSILAVPGVLRVDRQMGDRLRHRPASD